MNAYLDRVGPEFVRRYTSNLHHLSVKHNRDLGGSILTARAHSCVRVEELCQGWTCRRNITLTLPSYFPPGPSRGSRTLSIVNASLALHGLHENKKM